MSHSNCQTEGEALRNIAYDLLDCAEKPNPEPDAVARLKWEFGRQLNLCLLDAGRLAQDRSDCANCRTSLGAMTQFAETYRDFLAIWTADQVQQDGPEFRRATRILVGTLCQCLADMAPPPKHMVPLRAVGGG